ncbi:hypothetical protein COCON_G00184360 [Conger conger]|uniref:Uncharacterized protein n=1 Tax=Conger conger TaxID=82655 RepID=A0A9Q1D2I5_CONCO|nr:hypothetical protein COCON_G00184360 [Conger conger]
MSMVPPAASHELVPVCCGHRPVAAPGVPRRRGAPKPRITTAPITTANGVTSLTTLRCT